MFLDECGVTTDLLRRYGRAPSGTRLHDHTPCGHWQAHTVVAALRFAGLTAAAVFDEPIDGLSCLAYVELRARDVLPPYSPDLSPLNRPFAKLKAFLHAARPRTFEPICELMAAAVQLFPAAECPNYIRHAGYRVATQQ